MKTMVVWKTVKEDPITAFKKMRGTFVARVRSDNVEAEKLGKGFTTTRKAEAS
jgi:hypothetical protein